MKYFFLITVTILFLLENKVSGQNKTYFGIEVAVTNDVYEIADNGNNLKAIPIIEGLWGFNLRQDINSYLFLETGLIRNYYNEGFGFKTIDFSGSSNAIEAWMIPIRLGTKINIFKEKIYLVPVVGYSFCINSDYRYGGSSGQSSGTPGFNRKISSGGDSVSYKYSNNPNLTHHFSLLQTGLGFEFKILKTAILSISANYYTGFKRIVQLDIMYSSNNSPSMSGQAFSKGDFLSIGVGLKYPISNFWTKKL